MTKYATGEVAVVVTNVQSAVCGTYWFRLLSNGSRARLFQVVLLHSIDHEYVSKDSLFQYVFYFLDIHKLKTS